MILYCSQSAESTIDNYCANAISLVENLWPEEDSDKPVFHPSSILCRFPCNKAFISVYCTINIALFDYHG